MGAPTVRIIEEQRVPGRPLGRHVEHDPESRAYGIVTAPVPLQRVVHRRHGSIFNQGSLGSCTGNAICGAVNTEPVWAKGRRCLREADAIATYGLATTLDNIGGSYPPDDTGSSGLAACKAALQRGYITAYRHAFSLGDALQALQHGPVITGTDWYEGFDAPDAHGVVAIAGQVRGGHEYCAVGYDPATDLVMFDNSWGRGWGLKGTFFYTSKTWGVLLAAQGDATVPVR